MNKLYNLQLAVVAVDQIHIVFCRVKSRNLSVSLTANTNTIPITSDSWKMFFTNRTFVRLNSVKFCVELLDLICYSMAQFLSSTELTSGGIVAACLRVLLASFITCLSS